MPGNRDIPMIDVAPRDRRTTADLFFLHGHQYLWAAKKLSGESAERRLYFHDWAENPDVIVYLFCHSMELNLKSYLAESGFDFEKRPRDFHNLENLEKLCVQRGLIVDPFISEMILIMAKFNRAQEEYMARYAKAQGYSLPYPCDMNRAAQRLKETVHTARLELKNSSGDSPPCLHDR